MKISSISSRTLGKITGISLLIMMFAAFFSYGYVFDSLVDQTSASTTYHQVSKQQHLFIAGNVGWIIILITDILVTLSIYLYTKKLHPRLALAGMISRGLYTFILGIAITNLFLVVPQLSSLDHANGIMGNINQFLTIWTFGLIIFGLHLIFVGLACKQSVAIPRWIPFMLLIAGFSYTTLNVMNTFFPAFSELSSIMELILMLPMTVGELSFGIWVMTTKKIEA